MKSVAAKAVKGITTGTVLVAADNSGAKAIKVIGVKGYKGRKKRYPSAGIADVVIASVVRGNVEMRKQVVKAVIVRQAKELKRPDGTRVRFSDNAAVVVTEEGLPKGSEIKGVIAKEVATRWPKVAGIASKLA